MSKQNYCGCWSCSDFHGMTECMTECMNGRQDKMHEWITTTAIRVKKQRQLQLCKKCTINFVYSKPELRKLSKKEFTRLNRYDEWLSRVNLFTDMTDRNDDNGHLCDVKKMSKRVKGQGSRTRSILHDWLFVWRSSFSTLIILCRNWSRVSILLLVVSSIAVCSTSVT